MIKEGKAYLIGDGNNYLPLVHVSDAVQAFLLALTKTASDKRIYNISDGEDHTQKQLFHLTAELLKVPKPSKQVSNIIMNLMAKTKNIDSDELRFLTGSRLIEIARARKELGFKPKIEMRKGAEEVINAFNERQRYSEMRSIL